MKSRARACHRRVKRMNAADAGLAEFSEVLEQLMCVEGLELAREVFNGPRQVRLVRVLGDHAERLLFALAAIMIGIGERGAGDLTRSWVRKC